jgi:hypothetical protein
MQCRSSRFEKYHMKITWMSWLLPGLGMLWTQASAAAPPPDGACSKNAEQAREHVLAGRLRRARAAYAECAQSRCGALRSQQCRSALLQLDADTPTVIPVATDRNGVPQVDVSVSVDGEPLTTHTDGRSVEVDPGMHDFSFRTAQGDVQSEKVLILQGQRNRVLSVQLLRSAAPAAPSPAPPLPPPSEAAPPSSGSASHTPLAPAARAPVEDAPSGSGESRPTPLLAYVVGGAGLAAVGSSLLLAHWGREDNLLLDRCAPNCSRESVDHVRHLYIAADITLGAGVVALGAATWLYLSRPEVEDTRSARTYRFDVRPIASGAFATVGRAF